MKEGEKETKNDKRDRKEWGRGKEKKREVKEKGKEREINSIIG